MRENRDKTKLSRFFFTLFLVDSKLVWLTNTLTFQKGVTFWFVLIQYASFNHRLSRVSSHIHTRTPSKHWNIVGQWIELHYVSGIQFLAFDDSGSTMIVNIFSSISISKFHICEKKVEYNKLKFFFSKNFCPVLFFNKSLPQFCMEKMCGGKKMDRFSNWFVLARKKKFRSITIGCDV